MPISSFAALTVATRDALANSLGSAWQLRPESHTLLGQLSQWLAGEISVLEQREHQTMMRSRSWRIPPEIYAPQGCVLLEPRPQSGARDTTQVYRVPDWLLELDSVWIDGRWLERGTDFRIQNRNLILGPRVGPGPIKAQQVLGRHIVGRTFEFERFWSNLLGFSDYGQGSDRFYAALIRCGHSGFSRLDWASLVSAAMTVPYLERDGVVEAVQFGEEALMPRVITDQEIVTGAPDALPTVQVGDRVLAGDFVFSDLQVWDCRDPIPPQLASLSIPKQYLTFKAKSPVRISTTPAPGQVVMVGDQARVRYPITTDAETAAGWWLAQDAAEDASGIQLAQYITNSATPEHHTVLEPRNWLELLRTAWLQHGTVVTMVGNDCSISTEARLRLREIRRAVPPWISHLVLCDELEIDDVEC